VDGPDTRTRAVEKMKALRNKIGYPEAWRDYGKLKLSRKDHLGNVIAGRRFQFVRDADRISKAVDKHEWQMPPAIVNAYYNPSVNEMVFPAGILQPPYFSADFPMAMNFGGIGMVMGHELTHGFDDQGRKFDGQGRAARVVGAERLSQVHRAGPVRRDPVRRHRGAAGRQAQRQADPRREHRRLRRDQGRLRRLQGPGRPTSATSR
jgi:hypothetical protein